MSPTEKTKQYVIENYVRSARLRGDRTIQIRVGDLLRELGWTNRTPSVFSTLNSQSFQREAGLQLVEKRGGPVSGGPSTTWVFVYTLLPAQGAASNAGVPPTPNGSGLTALYGILADTYRQLGGGEAYLKSEREAWGADPWEKLEMERKTETDRQR